MAPISTVDLPSIAGEAEGRTRREVGGEVTSRYGRDTKASEVSCFMPYPAARLEVVARRAEMQHDNTLTRLTIKKHKPRVQLNRVY